MRAGKEVAVLALTVGLVCLGCQTSPHVDAQPKAPSYASRTVDGPVRAAPPLRISEPPAPPSVAQVAGQAPPPAVAPVRPTAAPPEPLPALPDLPAPGSTSAESKLRRMHRLAAEEYAHIDGYVARLTRREQVNGKDQPRELIKLVFRKEPWSVHLVWLEGDVKGREVVYVKGRYDNKLITRLGPNDGNLLLRPGSRIALALDSPMIRSSSRHTITEAGIGFQIDRFGSLVEANEKGDKRWGTLAYLGPQKRAEFAAPVETAEQVVPPGSDKDLPRGGRRLWMFDPKTHLPTLVITNDDQGHEVEYYLHDRLLYPVPLDDRDFDPDTLWGKP